MKSRLQNYNQKIGSKEHEADQEVSQALFDQYNDMGFAKMKKYDFTQSSFLGQSHIKGAVKNEKMRVMANGKRLGSLAPRGGGQLQGSQQVGKGDLRHAKGENASNRGQFQQN